MNNILSLSFSSIYLPLKWTFLHCYGQTSIVGHSQILSVVGGGGGFWSILCWLFILLLTLFSMSTSKKNSPTSFSNMYLYSHRFFLFQMIILVFIERHTIAAIAQHHSPWLCKLVRVFIVHWLLTLHRTRFYLRNRFNC